MKVKWVKRKWSILFSIIYLSIGNKNTQIFDFEELRSTCEQFQWRIAKSIASIFDVG